MSNKLYVGNLSFNVQEDVLTTSFEKFGQVTSCRIITDKVTGRSRGFAFVEMSNSSEAQDAISSLDGCDFDGRSLVVNLAKPMESNDRKRW